MEITALLPMIAVLAVAVAAALRLTAKRGRQTILDYQRGVRFERGKFQEILGPGCHRFHVVNEQITVVDLRDQPVIVERFAYPDRAGENAWVSIAASIRVTNACLVSTQCHDHVNEAVVLIRDALRSSLSARRAAENRRDRRGCELQLKTQMATELEKIGLALTSLEITKVSSAATDRVVGSTGVN